MLHRHIYVTEHGVIHGKGLVASEFIARGEIVWRRNAGEHVVHFAEIQKWSPQKREEFFWLAYQCGELEFVVPTGSDGYMNHSCNPNAWWLDDHNMFAARDIQAGEEVTYDYATSEILLDFSMECHCGSNLCRGVICHMDYRNPAWQRRYGQYLPSYTLKAISQSTIRIES
jgi:uncharacterized protein